ncbi:MAG: hypothetical protein ACTSWY_06715 [Promethearchaeota archaeon]
MVLKKGFKGISTIKKICFFTLWGLLVALVLLLGNVDLIENRKIHYNENLGAFSIGLITAVFLICIVYFILLLSKFKDPNIKRKFKFFIIGCVLYFAVFYQVVFLNLGLLQIEIFLITGSIAIIFGSIALYFGIGRRKIKNNEIKDKFTISE